MHISILVSSLEKLEKDYRAGHPVKTKLFGGDYLNSIMSFKNSALSEAKKNEPDTESILDRMYGRLRAHAITEFPELKTETKAVDNFITKLNEEPNKHIFFRGLATILQSDGRLNGLIVEEKSTRTYAKRVPKR